MPRYQISITLEVETDNPGGWAFAAAEHLNESFNDDGTLLDPLSGTAVLNGLPVTVFVSVRTSQHDDKWLARFAAAVTALPEVQEFHRMSGDVDYLLKVVASSIDGYDRFYKKLISLAEMAGVSSAFSMEQIKSTTALPLV